MFDTETTVDETQALLFGAYRYVMIDHTGPGAVQVTTVAEGLIYADDLPERDPTGYDLLRGYVRAGSASVDLLYPGAVASWRLDLLSRREFVKRWLWRVCNPNNKRDDPAMVVAFNDPFDLYRIAVDVSEARGDLRGGFSFVIWDDETGNPAPFRPRLGIKNIDSKRALKKFRKVEPRRGDQPGHLLDLRTLVFALTGESHSLDGASKAFGVDGKADQPPLGKVTREAIDYCREDVAATARLLQATLSEFTRHPLALDPHRAYSPASLAKAYLHALGVTPRLSRQPDFPSEILGASMSAFYGGRADVHIRHVPLPVQVVDFTSMYPTVDTLMKIWDLVTAETITPVEATDDLQGLLDRIGTDDLFDPTLWPQFVGIAEIVPDGEVVPVRADYAPNGWSIGMNELHDDHPHWFTLPDLIASKLHTGRTPQIRRGIRFVPDGRQDGLRAVALRGEVEIDPASDDFFRRVVEERQRLKAQTGGHGDDCTCQTCGLSRVLKVLANSGSYGIYAEMVPSEQPGKVTVYTGHEDPFPLKVNHPETPGMYAFPPIAAVITGAARLMLTMLERQVRDLGGTWMFCDTDSMAIVATPNGGELFECPGGDHQLPDGRPAVIALSSSQVDDIRSMFGRLNPYDPDLVTDVLHRDKEGLCLAISAKRYVVYSYNEAGEIDIVKRSEHGLGRYLPPVPNDLDETGENDEIDPKGGTGSEIGNWVDDAWRWIIIASDDPDTPLPPWADQPALTRITVSSPALARPFRFRNAGKRWADQIKPFNFLLVADGDPFGIPPDANPQGFRLIAPYRSGHERQQLEWQNLYDETAYTYEVTTNPDEFDTGKVGIKSYGRMLREYRMHPEHKSLGPEARPCRRATRGVLTRRVVTLAEVVYIGKEANRLEDVQAGIVGSLDEVLTEFQSPKDRVLHELALPLLDRLSGRKLARITGTHRRTIDRTREGHQPRPRLRAQLMQLALEMAYLELGSASRLRGDVPALVLRAWQSQSKQAPPTAPSGY